MRLIRPDGAESEFAQLTSAEVKDVLAALDEDFPILPGRPDYRIKRGSRSIGTVRIGATRIMLRKFALPQIADLQIESTDYSMGEDPSRKALARYIDREDLFTILFSEPTLAYVEGELFRDEAMVDGGASFLRRLIPFEALKLATSEKGEFTADQTAFTSKSVFRIIVDNIAANDDVLVCDDLGDEWADFIGLNTTSEPQSINFYHGKCGDVTLSASAFHEAVSQAEKNLGRMALAPDAMTSKYRSWSQSYRNDGVQTSIRRRIRGGEIERIQQRFDEIRSAPDAVRRVYIVTSSLSKAQVEAEFARLAGGGRPKAHFVQLYWLLTAYFSACAEMGAVGFVACRP